MSTSAASAPTAGNASHSHRAQARNSEQSPPIGELQQAIERVCVRAGDWYRGLPTFPTRAKVGGGQVVGRRQPGILSERDCVVAFARLLHEEGVPWSSIHHEISISRWIFEAPHPAATVMTQHASRRRVDLAIIGEEAFLAAELPATDARFQFDAFIEFGYVSDYFKVDGARNWGEPEKGRTKIASDIAKIERHLAAGACALGYVIVFEECDYDLGQMVAAAEAGEAGCRVRRIRGYPAG